MDDPLPLTPTGDTIFEDTNDSTESEWDPKNNCVVLAQPTVEKAVTPLIPSTEALQDVEYLPTQDAQDPPSKDDPSTHDVKDPLA